MEEHARNLAVDTMSVKELKKTLKEQGIDFSDCFEKSELKKRLKDANDGKRVPRVAKGGVSQADVARRAAAAHLKSGTSETSKRREFVLAMSRAEWSGGLLFLRGDRASEPPLHA